MKNFRIAAALINRFFKRLYSDDDDKEIAMRIKQRLNEENGLKNHVIMCKSHLKSQNTRIEDCLISDFPVFSLQTIKNYITLGNYQLNQSLSYIAEHLNGGKDDILINKEYFDKDGRKILLAEIQSRLKILQFIVRLLNIYQIQMNHVQFLLGIVIVYAVAGL